MFLAFSISDLITVPFGYLLSWLYNWTSSYGVALIIFAVLVKLILFPVSAKSKQSTMKMSRLAPQMQEIQKKYADDQAKQSQALRELQQREGVSMFGGCLWGFVPLLLLLPLYAVVRQPITYMLHQSGEVAAQIVDFIKNANPDLFSGNSFYNQMIAARHIPEFAQQLQQTIPGLSGSVLNGVNFTFLGIDLGVVPQFNIFAWDAYDWAHIGAFLIPILSAASQVLTMFIAQKTNNSVITDQNGVRDEEAAKNSQANQMSKGMMFMMPLMSLWIGFTIPAALSLYWFIQGIVSAIMDTYLTVHYRKIYDEEDARRLQQLMEQEAIEAEKERIRAARRAANPDGITENTSKKKLQQKQQREQAQQKAAAAREYAMNKGLLSEEDQQEDESCLSGIPSRPYCKGRAYDPNRYGSTPTKE